ncbi:SIS domain-containing protein [Pediococcus pentosaceus]|jgi:Predicted phosphosugar isomerases|uniref:SIS domain-containing protein n=1 Tax=Pediococcus pentosaceus TaxID=1255 RepID=UPI00201700F0|nr:SIS domain-containing protein [Pediococcus pentosaceus]MCL3859241.1 SIS domain-containing protein [Pediococcus pentosaceus]MEB3377840.1 SIS domain-containing protein [Pediococcus pentosaceus]
MLKFNEQKQLDNVNGALSLKPEVEKWVDKIWDRGFENICFLGIGGTYASALQVEKHLKAKSKLKVIVEEAAEFLTTGNKNVTDQTIVIISSVTGNTKEMVEAMEKIKEIGSYVIEFIDEKESTLAKMFDNVISYPGDEQLKFFLVADYLMYKNEEFDDYENYYDQLEKNLAKDLVAIEKSADNFGKEFAEKHRHDEMQYYIGAGNQWGSTYSYAMCYVEEQHWLRSKSITAAEFFHGTLEIIDENTSVTLFIGEDAERPLAERVKKFLPKVCGNYTIIDSKDYPLDGIDEKYRGYLSHLVTHCVTQRIDAHIEHLNRHPMDIRRYYRQFDY